jgi:hypothetical protein
MDINDFNIKNKGISCMLGKWVKGPSLKIT